MKVYVSELPKSCEKCKFYEYEIEHNGEWGFETHRHICKINGSLIQGICPLQSLSDYTKQVRKEVCEDIRNKIKQAKLIYEWQGKEITIEHILDQIQEK